MKTGTPEEMRTDRLYILLKALALFFVLISTTQTSAMASTDNSSDSLCIRSFPESALLWQQDLARSGSAFSLHFLHSVSNTPVEDQYGIQEGKIVQRAEIFVAHGAGLPSLMNEVGAQSWSHEKGRFVLKMKRPIDNLIIRVNPDYQNRLTTEKTQLDLTQWGRRALSIQLCE